MKARSVATDSKRFHLSKILPFPYHGAADEVRNPPGTLPVEGKDSPFAIIAL